MDVFSNAKLIICYCMAHQIVSRISNSESTKFCSQFREIKTENVFLIGPKDFFFSVEKNQNKYNLIFWESEKYGSKKFVDS